MLRLYAILRFVFALVLLVLLAMPADAACGRRAHRQARSPAAACGQAAQSPRFGGGIVNAVKVVWWFIHPGILHRG